MSPDPNWLLSTVVQSTAAFVAIVAGFIISRLLALSAERNGLQTKIRDVKLQSRIQDQTLGALERRLLEWDAIDFIEDHDVMDMIVESGDQMSLAEAMKQASSHDRSEDELRPYWNEAIATAKNAHNIVKENFSRLNDHEDLEALLKNLGINISSYREKIYHRVFSRILSESRVRRSPLGSMVDAMIPTIPFVGIRTASEVQRYDLLRRDIETLKQEKSALETQSSDLEAQLAQIGQPEGVTLGIALLAYFSLVGIVIPVFLLPFPTAQFTLIHKWCIGLLFFSGLLFFFTYLFKLVRQLTAISGPNGTA